MLWAQPQDTNLPASLTSAEQGRLSILEGIVERGQQTFIEVGQALLEIRDERLYRAEHKTFEDYCEARWGWSRGRAYQYMDAAKVVAAVSTTVDAAPANEAQARELVPLLRSDPEALTAAWRSAQEQAAEQGRPVTAAIVRQVVKEGEGTPLLKENEPPRAAPDLPSLAPAKVKALTDAIKEFVGIQLAAERRLRVAILKEYVVNLARIAAARGEEVDEDAIGSHFAAEATRFIFDGDEQRRNEAPRYDAKQRIREWGWGWLLDEGLPTKPRDE